MQGNNANSSVEVKNSNLKNNGLGSVENPTKENDMVLQSLMVSGYISVSGEFSEKAETDLGFLAENNIKYHLVAKALVSDLEAAGYKLCFVTENREIHAKHLDFLIDDIGSETLFTEAGKCVPAEKVILEGLHLKDFDGNDITIDTDDIENYIVVLDGQHRSSVHHENPKIDLYLEFVDYSCSTMEYINRLNSKRKEWDGSDLRHSVEVLRQGEVPVLVEIDNAADVFGSTLKWAEFLMTREKDQFRKGELSELQKGGKVNQNKYAGNAEFIKTGWAIGYAIKETFGKDRRVMKIEFLDALFNIPGYLSDDTNFNRDIVAFIAKLDLGVRANIINRIDKRNWDDLKQYVFKEYTAFVKTNKNKLEKLSAEADAIVKKQEQEMANAVLTAKAKKLKSGSVEEVLANRKLFGSKKKKAVIPLGSSVVNTGNSWRPSFMTKNPLLGEK